MRDRVEAMIAELDAHPKIDLRVAQIDAGTHVRDLQEVRSRFALAEDWYEIYSQIGGLRIEWAAKRGSLTGSISIAPITAVFSPATRWDGPALRAAYEARYSTWLPPISRIGPHEIALLLSAPTARGRNRRPPAWYVRSSDGHTKLEVGALADFYELLLRSRGYAGWVQIQYLYAPYKLKKNHEKARRLFPDIPALG